MIIETIPEHSHCTLVNVNMCTRVRVLHLYLKYTICLRYYVNNNTCLMGDAILRIPRDARVRAYCAWDTYDGVVSATSKRQLSCQSILYTSVESMCYQTGIDLYRDVWIAAIASSRKSLATQTAAICVRFHGRRVRHEYVTMHITFLTRKSALIYRRGLR